MQKVEDRYIVLRYTIEEYENAVLELENMISEMDDVEELDNWFKKYFWICDL